MEFSVKRVEQDEGVRLSLQKEAESDPNSPQTKLLLQIGKNNHLPDSMEGQRSYHEINKND